ncbi:uncharacterized protein [Palaemon carinicauda]|uniref:uncharacterized protein n=1 Tax=Palaemon carinicauda TaxID=392227 RepID=UPI0035B58CC8
MSETGETSKTRQCVFCSQVFCSKDELQAHFRRHANREIDIKGKPRAVEKKTEAASPGKSSSEKSNVPLPPKVVDNAVCDVCGEHFSTVSLAISHKFRKHPESEVKHYCPHCGMMFPIKVNRDNHVLTHPSVTPKQVFPCMSCGVSFYNLAARKFHMDSAHKGSNRMINPIDTPAPSLKIVLNNAGEAYSVYYCHLCGCEYQVKYNLQKHLETRHSELERNGVPEQIVQCNLCTALFYSKRAYEAHSHHHRESDLYATNEAMRQSIVQRIDQDFDQRRVPTTIERYLSASAVSSNRSATWRNIRAARRKEELLISRPKQKHIETKELVVKINSKYVPVASKKSRTQSLSSGCSVLPTSGLNISDKSVFSDGNTSEDVDDYMQGENLCWGMGSKSTSKKRMLNDSEEDDSEIRTLGSVNPDTVMPNPKLICGDVGDKILMLPDNKIEKSSENLEDQLIPEKVIAKNERRTRNKKIDANNQNILFPKKECSDTVGDSGNFSSDKEGSSDMLMA